MSDERVFT